MIDRRRWPSAIPAAGSVHTSESSGPRWATASLMARTRSARSLAVAERPSRNPAMPHTQLSPRPAVQGREGIADGAEHREIPCQQGNYQGNFGPQGPVGVNSLSDFNALGENSPRSRRQGNSAREQGIPVQEQRIAGNLAASRPHARPLLQRVGIEAAGLVAVPRPRIDAFPLRKGLFFQAPAVQQPRQAIVSFDAARLVIDPVLRLVLFDELLLGGPRPGPGVGIVGRDLIFKRGWSGPRPALDEVQVFARPLEIGLRTEVRHVDDKRIALPMAARVAVPLADAGRQMRAAVHDDVALPALALADIVEDRDAARRLHDAAET